MRRNSIFLSKILTIKSSLGCIFPDYQHFPTVCHEIIIICDFMSFIIFQSNHDRSAKSKGFWGWKYTYSICENISILIRKFAIRYTLCYIVMNTKLAFDMKVYNIFCKYYFFQNSIVWPNFEHAPTINLLLINQIKSQKSSTPLFHKEFDDTYISNWSLVLFGEDDISADDGKLIKPRGDPLHACSAPRSMSVLVEHEQSILSVSMRVPSSSRQTDITE